MYSLGAFSHQMWYWAAQILPQKKLNQQAEACKTLYALISKHCMFSFCQGFWDSQKLLRHLSYNITDCDTPLPILYKQGKPCCSTQVLECVIHPEMHRGHQTSESLSTGSPAVVSLILLKRKVTMSDIS